MLKGQTFDDFDSTKDEVYLQVADKESQNFKDVDRRNSSEAVADKDEEISLSEENFVHSERNKHSINYSPRLSNHIFALNSTQKHSYPGGVSPISMYTTNAVSNQPNIKLSPICQSRVQNNSSFPERIAQTSFIRNITPTSCRANIINTTYSRNITPNPIFHKGESPLLQSKNLHNSPERRSKLEEVNYQWGTSTKQLKPTNENNIETVAPNFQNPQPNFDVRYSPYPEVNQRYPAIYYSDSTNACHHDARIVNSRLHNNTLQPRQIPYPEKDRPTVNKIVYPQQIVSGKKYSTLNPASLCELESKCGPQCYCSHFCPDSPCKYTYPRSIDCYATLGPNYRQNSNQYYSSLPRIKNNYDIYDNCYNCQECTSRNGRLKTAFSSQELNRGNLTQYQIRPYGSKELAPRTSVFNDTASTSKCEQSYKHGPHLVSDGSSESSRFNSIIKKINQDLGFGTLDYKPRSYEEVFTEAKFVPTSSNYVKRSKSFTTNGSCPRFLQDDSNQSCNSSYRSSCETIMKRSPNTTRSQNSKPVPSRVTFHISGNSDATSSDSPSHGLETTAKDWRLSKRDDEKSASDFEEDENSTSSSTEETLSLKNQKFETFYSNNTILLKGNDQRTPPQKSSNDNYFR